MSKAESVESPSELDEQRQAFLEAFRGMTESEQVRLTQFIEIDAPAAIAKAEALPPVKAKK